MGGRGGVGAGCVLDVVGIGFSKSVGLIGGGGGKTGWRCNVGCEVGCEIGCCIGCPFCSGCIGA